jgi:hypothetical protein
VLPALCDEYVQLELTVTVQRVHHPHGGLHGHSDGVGNPGY